MNQSDSNNYKENEIKYFENIEKYFNKSKDDFSEKMHAFSKYTPRQSIAYFMAREEIFKKIINLHGSVLDFGVYKGSSFFTYLQISSILEPYNHTRKFVGFDSFLGFTEITEKDNPNKKIGLKKKGGMIYKGGGEYLQEGLNLLDMNRVLGHVENSEIIEGVLPDKLLDYLNEHDETIIALANFGLGLYEPTKIILEAIKPRLIKGSILVFEELNQATWPGETKALFEVFEAKNITLKRFEYAPHVSYFVYEG